MKRREVSSVEVFGFLGWITTSIAYVLFLVWSFTPDDILHRFEITYYPSKYWALALPTWLCVSGVYVYFAYACFNMQLEQDMIGAASADTTSNTRVTSPNTVRYFNTHAQEPILSLVRLPDKLVRMVLDEDVPPLGA